jgi:hypothetical protein
MLAMAAAKEWRRCKKQAKKRRGSQCAYLDLSCLRQQNRCRRERARPEFNRIVCYGDEERKSGTFKIERVKMMEGRKKEKSEQAGPKCVRTLKDGLRGAPRRGFGLS